MPSRSSPRRIQRSPTLQAVMLAVATMLAACGGGDDADAGTPLNCPTCQSGSSGGGSSAERATVEGYWAGSGGPYTFGTLVLDDGTSYTIYLRGSTLAGVTVGSVTSSDGSFSGSGTDFNFELPAITAATLAGTYNVRSQLHGTIAVGSQRIDFSGAYDPTYNVEVDVASLAGRWTGGSASAGGVVSGSAVFAGDGSFTTQTAFCTGTGSVRPRRSGKHPLAVTLALTGSNCEFAGQTLRGIAVVAADGRSMVAIALNRAGDNGAFAALER